MRMFRLIFAVLFVILASCGRANKQTSPSDLFSGVPVERDSLGEVSDSLIEGDKALMLKIDRKAFGEKFLLSGAVIPQKGAPTGTSLAGRVVRFEKFEDSVDMYDASTGLVVTNDLPSRQLLATFPVVSEDETSVIIDFNQGMNKVFTLVWVTGAKTFDASAGEAVSRFSLSRVFEVSSQEPYLVIRQIAGVEVESSGSTLESQTEIRYFLSQYVPSSMTPKEAEPNNRNVRYFTTAPKLEPKTGRSYSYITRFDPSKTIEFHYSANTPAEYEKAVIKGIEYWNLAFGKKVIVAKKAPEGVSAPDPQYNVVQWVPWDNAGFAYADLIVDPESGENLRAQVFMTSVFATSTISRARAIVRGIKSGSIGRSSQFGVGIGFMAPQSLCSLNDESLLNQFATSLENLLSQPGLTDEAVLRYTQNYVSDVIAHEIGHVLGLRHNFAGNLAATISPKQVDDWIVEFLKSPETAETGDDITSSSVMEYQVNADSVFSGQKILEHQMALPYDERAIQWGYFDDESINGGEVLFCTDEETTVWKDCRVFDRGSEMHANEAHILGTLNKSLPQRVIERFISETTTAASVDRLAVESVNLNASSYVSDYLTPVVATLSWYTGGARSLAVESKFPFYGDLTIEEIETTLWQASVEKTKAFGGIEKLVFGYLPSDVSLASTKGLDFSSASTSVASINSFNVEALTNATAELLNSEAYGEFIGLDGKVHSFTQAEKDLILQRSRKLFASLELALTNSLVQILSQIDLSYYASAASPAEEEDLLAMLEVSAAKMAAHVLTALPKDASEEATYIRGKIRQSIRLVKDYAYPVATRVAAASLLSSEKFGGYGNWSAGTRASVKAELIRYLKSSLDLPSDVDLAKVKNTEFSRSIDRWYLDQISVISAIR